MLTSSMFSSQNIDCEALETSQMVIFYNGPMQTIGRSSLNSASRLYHGSSLCGPVIVVY